MNEKKYLETIEEQQERICELYDLKEKLSSFKNYSVIMESNPKYNDATIEDGKDLIEREINMYKARIFNEIQHRVYTKSIDEGKSEEESNTLADNAGKKFIEEIQSVPKNEFKKFAMEAYSLVFLLDHADSDFEEDAPSNQLHLDTIEYERNMRPFVEEENDLMRVLNSVYERYESEINKILKGPRNKMMEFMKERNE